MTTQSGNEIELLADDQRAVLDEVGGGIRSYTARGREVLDGYPAGQPSPSGRGQVLIPWPNRLEDGSYEFDGQRHQLELNEPENGNAIHGLVRWEPWTVGEREPHRVVMGHVIHPRPGYPFALSLTIEYLLSAEGLGVSVTATNSGETTCPYGCGAHPYLRIGDTVVDSLTLRAPAHTVLRSNDRGIPVAAEALAGTGLDFRETRSIGETQLDHAFTDLTRDDEGRARVTLKDPAGGDGVTLWMDENYGYVMLFTGDPLPDVARRSLAVEPMTCPPNSFRSGESLISLEPGRSITSRWGIA